MIHEVPASSPDFAQLTELRNFQFGQSVERRVEVYPWPALPSSAPTS